jgi:hypothetical protein
MLKEKNMKKQYIKPQMETVQLEMHLILAGSGQGNMNAPRFDWDYDEEE